MSNDISNKTNQHPLHSEGLGEALLTFLLLFFPFFAFAQTDETVHFDESEGLSNRHITQLLQDKDGFMWFATWNGLNRFDGREFVTFKSRPGDGVSMPSDRFRNIAIDSHNPNIINCLVDKQWFRFSLLDGTFSPVSSAESKALKQHPGYGNGRAFDVDGTKHFQLRDRQGLLWNVLDDGFELIIPHPSFVGILPWSQPSEVKCIFVDSQLRLWVSSKEDKMVRIYTMSDIDRYIESGFSPLSLPIPRYLRNDGTISSTPVAFGSPIYCISQFGKDIYLGSKPDGLFILHDEGDRYSLEHIIKGQDGMPASEIYDMKRDQFGRIWFATLDAGLVCYDGKQYHSIRFGNENRVRRLVIKDDNVLLAATTEGLLVGNINKNQKTVWHLHQREANREASLSNNACMDIMPLSDGKIIVSTESGGINEIITNNLLAPSLSFRHFDKETGLGSDIILSLVYAQQEKVLATSDNSLMMFDSKTNESQEYSQNVFGRKLSFSDCRPSQTPKAFLLGLTDGLAVISKQMFDEDTTCLPIVLTSMKIEDGQTDYTVNQLNEITLSPDERTIAISFAVLDYRNPRHIRYAYRIGSEDWHYLGNDNNVSLSQLSPGTYHLQLRATNAMGKWNPETRSLTINVKPKFTETVWFQLLLILFLLSLIGTALWTRRYIRRIRKKQKETLDAYLALLEQHTANDVKTVKPSADAQKNTISSTDAKSQENKHLSAADEQFMSRVVAFVEAHLSDSDATIDDMASDCAVSRSSLNRKMKSIVGVTPADFLREARIKRACQLLADKENSVTDVAYRCGFTDPKYFSRTFRQIVGQSPSDYRAASDDVQ